jgi:hypothetical protein
MNPLQNYNFVPSTVSGNQFLSYRQPGYYMTDYRPSSDMYAYLVNDASGKGVMTGNQLRQYLQDNAGNLSNQFFNSTAQQFINMQTPGAPNTCTGSEAGVIYSGGKPLVNAIGQEQMFTKQCNVPGQSCMMLWNNTPLPQQGPHCQVPPTSYYPPFALLSDSTVGAVNTMGDGQTGGTGRTGGTGQYS